MDAANIQDLEEKTKKESMKQQLIVERNLQTSDKKRLMKGK